MTKIICQWTGEQTKTLERSLARLFSKESDARYLLRETHYPEVEIPSWEGSLVFWNEIFDGLQKGKVPGDVYCSLLDVALGRLPANPDLLKLRKLRPHGESQWPQLSGEPAASTSRAAEWDFCICHTHSDTDWADWVAWQLDNAGYRVLLVHAWDLPGFDWWRRRGIEQSRWTIELLSADSTASEPARQVWLSSLLVDGKLLPIRVEDVESLTPLRHIMSIDLFGLTEDAARTRLLEQIRRVFDGAR